MNIVDIAKQDDRFSTLVTALEKAELVDTLMGEGPFTVFAPTNEAFDELGDMLQDVLADKETLKDILLYHVVSGKKVAADIQSGDLATMQGESLLVSVDDQGILIDEGEVVQADIEADNGVIHVVDTVLLPIGEEEDTEFDSPSALDSGEDIG